MQVPNQVQQPWDFDPYLYPQLLQEQAKEKKRFTLFLELKEIGTQVQQQDFTTADRKTIQVEIPDRDIMISFVFG